MKNTRYFSHDTNARNDPKLQRLLMRRGVAGIGIYWCIIEMLYEEGGEMMMSDVKTIAFALRVHENTVVSVIEDFGLFFTENGKFWSESVRNRLKVQKTKTDRLSFAGKKGMENRWGKDTENATDSGERPKKNNEVITRLSQNDNEVITRLSQNDNEVITIKENKIKENKEKEIDKEKDGQPAKRFVPPTIEEVKKYIDEKGYSRVNAERFVNFYESKGWMVGKNKMQKWKSAVANWENSERGRPRRNNEKFSDSEWSQ